MKKVIRLTESDLHYLIKESVNNLLQELDWKTYMNASRKRKLQADTLRDKYYNTLLGGRNAYDGMSDELEKAAQASFQKKHGKDGHSHQYDGDYTDFRGRRTVYGNTDWDFEHKAPTKSGWWNGEMADGIRNYRYGNGIPSRNSGKVVDDTFDFAFSDKDGWTGDRQRYHTMNVDGNGIQYDPYSSSVGNEVSKSTNKDYNDALDNMANDMYNYYSGKSKYEKGKGWN